MKVKYGTEQKRYVTVAEVPAVKDIIAQCREYDIKDFAIIAAHAIKNTEFEIMKAEAEIAKNCRVWNYYGEESGSLDVWISFYAFNDYTGFYMIGAYLSDIDTLSADELRPLMYVREFKEVK